MRDFFRFFWLSFFSDKIAAEAPDRKVYTAFVSLFIAFILFVVTLVAADFCSFSVQYGKADAFNSLVNNAFAGDIDTRISLDVSDGRIFAARSGGECAKAKVINSFTDDSEYSVGGYNFVVDTRAMTAYDAFEVSFEGCGVTAEQYAGLPFAAKKNFVPKIVMTDKERVLDGEFVATCEAYLDKMSDKTGVDYDKDISDAYAAIKGSTADPTEKNGQIYALYLRAYYPSLFDGKTGVPNLRNYYAAEYMEDPDVRNYLFVFEDMIVGSFEANGVARKFYGYASKLDDGAAVTATDTGAAQQQIKNFIKSAYNGSLGISTYLYFINSRRIFLFAIGIWLVPALIAFGISRAVKRDIPKKFGEWFKISGAFILWSALITAVIGFICGFFVSLDTVFALITPLFGGIMLVRLIVFFLLSALRKPAPHSEAEQSRRDDIFDADVSDPPDAVERSTENNGNTALGSPSLKIFVKRG